MIAIQAIDWIATMVAVVVGGLALSQVSTAAILPVPFVVALLWWHPRRSARRA